MDSRNWMVCGVSFRRTAVEAREKISIPSNGLANALGLLKGMPGVRECMILSTCNRSELYLAVDDRADGKDLFVRFGQTACGTDSRRFDEEIYVLRGEDAIRHSFRVASSLDSMVLGEPQILGQMKTAFREAEKCGCIGRSLHRWIPAAFSAAKGVRNESGIGDAAISVSYAAVQLAKRIFENLSGKSVVLLGAGDMGKLAALHMKKAGAAVIAIANRTRSRAEEVAEACSGDVVDFENRIDRIAQADIVICATNAPHAVLMQKEVRERLAGRSGRPLLILDISVPRNVEGSIGALDGVYLFNVDDLQEVVRANRQSREEELTNAEAIVQKALEKFIRGELTCHMGPEIKAMRNQIDLICRTELDRLMRLSPRMSPEECSHVELMLHRIAQQIGHAFIMELKADNASELQKGIRSLVEKLHGSWDRANPVPGRSESIIPHLQT